MSATNRGAIRHKDDYYATPGWAVRAVLPHLLPRLPERCSVLEPSAGEGAIVVELLRAGVAPQRLMAIEIDIDRAKSCAIAICEATGISPESLRAPREDGVGPFAGVNLVDFRMFADVTRRDRSLHPDPVVGFDLIITNPPFSLAREFVTDALSILRPGGAVAMLLRLPWLAGQERADWLAENTPSIYVLSRRPSFYVGAPPTPQPRLFGADEAEDIDGSGSDNTDYAWLVWRPGTPPTAAILKCEKADRRRR
jgi:hypothetical protein